MSPQSDEESHRGRQGLSTDRGYRTVKEDEN